uniref:Uncharacterized protein n=1 Tax=Timema shepardi TaxID=629360 RepID=A0A7R9B747_TIMSH|nr:unnamed protein product [Timema shepardi]
MEDSNMAEDFKDIINYEAQRFEILDVERKSLLDGFLPIKEEIKDEPDTTNFVDEIVKTEMKLYDTSFGIMDSKIEHLTPVDKSEIKLEQNQFTLPSEILQSNIIAQTRLQSNIIAQTRCDFNSNNECVNENQDLSFNALHKKAECRNLSLKRLSSKFHKNITSEYKTSFLNSDQTKYVKEYKGAFSDNVYKIQAFSDNHLTSKKVNDNVEINISSKNPKLGGLCVSTKATDTNVNWTSILRKKYIVLH